MATTPQVFGLTTTTGYVQGEAIRYQMIDGAFSPADDPMSALTTQELEAIGAQATAQMDAVQRYALRAPSAADMVS